MTTDIELISDANGLTVVGEPDAVEQFLASEGLVAARPIGLARLKGALSKAATAAQAGAEVSANSGRWVQLTKESADAIKKYGLVDSKVPGVKHAMVGKPGEIKQWIQIAKTPSALLTNPAILSGAAGIMSQVALQQQMAEIAEYLAAIDEKLDDVLRAQTNQVLARLDGIALAIREAETVRDSVGRVSDITWSKLQTASTSIMETQGYALRQIGDLADKLDRKAKIDDLADAAKETEREVQKWLTVLARCFSLHDAVAVLELDRVLDASPDELDRHRLGLEAARRNRLELISQSTERLLARMSHAAELANSKVLLHPTKSPAIVSARNEVALGVGEFHDVLGIGAATESHEPRKWIEAADEQWDKVRERGGDGVDAVRQFGSGTIDQARSVKARLTQRLDEQRGKRRFGRSVDGDGQDASEEPQSTEE